MPPVVELPSAVSNILERKGRGAAEEEADVEPELAAADDDGAEPPPKELSGSNPSNGSSKKGKKKRGASPKPSLKKPNPTKSKIKTSTIPAQEDEEGEAGSPIKVTEGKRGEVGNHSLSL